MGRMKAILVGISNQENFVDTRQLWPLLFVWDQSLVRVSSVGFLNAIGPSASPQISVLIYRSLLQLRIGIVSSKEFPLNNTNCREKLVPHSLVAYVLDCGIVVSEFELQSRYYVLF